MQKTHTKAAKERKPMKQIQSSDLKIRVLKKFTDFLMLKHLKQNPKSSGYQILRNLNEKYNIHYSPGTIYNAIYTLERKGLITSDGDETCRVYSLTEIGAKTLKGMLSEGKEIQELIVAIFATD